MPIWPRVKIKQHDLLEDPQSIQVSISCEMFCKKPMEVTGQCKKDIQGKYKQSLKNDLNQRAKHHVNNCKTCQRNYLKK